MKKLILVTTTILLILILFFNRYLVIEYNIGVLDLVNESYRLTNEEKLWLKEHGDIVYGADNNSPPLRFLDEKTGQYQGVTVDYLAALSLEIGVNIKVKPMIWNDALKSLELGKIDICDMYPSEERALVYDFSNPIYYQRSIILSDPKNKINSYKDLKKLRVATQTGDYAHEFLKNSGVDIDFVFTNDYAESIELMEKKAVDAIVGDEPVISFFIDKMNIRNKYVIAQEPLFEGTCILAVPKGETILLNIINKGIYRLQRKAVMTRIQQKWFGISHPITENSTDKSMNLLIIFFSTSILATIIIFYIWNCKLKREVEKRTQELYVSRNDLQKTFDGVTNLMIVINKDCEITNVNRAFCKEVKERYKNLVGRSCNSFFRKISGDDNMCIIKQTLLTGKNMRRETKNNGKVFELTSFALEDSEGEIDRVLIMMKDITELKIRDNQILQSNKMAAIGQLAAGVAHEIRNPLGIIRNSSYILKKNSEFNKVMIEEAISMIDESVNRASGIIDNLLNFSRLSPSTTEKVNVLLLIDSIIKLYTKAFLQEAITIDIICDPYLTCVINQESLKHIIINLISNSIDAINESGNISISVSTENDKLKIRYSDNGSGIDEEYIDKIFNPFYTTKEPGEGTGLGLYIVYNEIEKMKGEINVDSTLNKGTTFNITIPIKGE